MNEEIKISKDIARVEGFPDYMVNKRGEFFNTYRHPRVKFNCKKHLTNRGYEQIWLKNRETSVYKTKLVHRVVLSSFVPNPDPKKYNQVNHKDGNKLNNHLSNLEWSNASHNTAHKHKVLKKGLGENAPKYKLKEIQVREIYHSHLSNKELSIKYAVSDKQIYRIKKKINWGHLNYE